jgi:DNA-sulfur modification-associated
MSNFEFTQVPPSGAAVQPGGGALAMPFDFSRGQPIPAVALGEHEAMAVMTVGQLLAVVPDPRKSEDPKEVAHDPTLAAYAGVRNEVQRAVQGAKAKNAVAFARYLIEGLRDERPWIVPAITLYHPLPLESVALPNGLVLLVLPYGDFFVAIDGETQRIAWQLVAQELATVLGQRVKVVIHHGKDERVARQGFYDLNTREVKPNAALAIGMDSMDLATKITRRVMEESLVLREGGVNLQRRQLRRSDKELMTISGLRTGVVTTILGAPGLQVGSRPIDPTHPNLEGVDPDVLGNAVVDVWTALLEALKQELKPERRADSVVSAPAILAGLGVLAHHAVPKPPRKEGVSGWNVAEVLDHLDGVNWDRTYIADQSADQAVKASPWEGIAGKFTPAGSFSIGGPKEVGYAVADALENLNDEAGRKIRSRLGPGTDEPDQTGRSGGE